MSFLSKMESKRFRVQASSTSLYKLPLTIKAFLELSKLDDKLIGTFDYMGLAYFWGMEYKHYLRDATPTIRKKVHDAWLKDGLDFLGKSPEHESVLKKYGLLK